MSIYSSLSDADLFTLIKESDNMAFNEAVERYNRPLLKASYGMLKYDRDKVEEPVCAAYKDLWEKRSQIDANITLWGFLRSKFNKTAMEIMKRSKHWDDYLDILSKFLDEGPRIIQLDVSV